MEALELFKKYLVHTGTSVEDTKNLGTVAELIKEIIVVGRDDDEYNGDSRWWTDITCIKSLRVGDTDYVFNVPYAKCTEDSTVEDMGFCVDLLKELTVAKAPTTVEHINVNHDGELMHEILRLTKVEEVEIMLDSSHHLHNKLILMTFLNSDDRGAISLAMVAIVSKSMPTNLRPSTTVEYILNCPSEVVDALVTLFDLGNFFTSEGSVAQIKLLIEEDDDLICLRSLRLDGHNNEMDLVDN